jgi:glycosyltransferase involved in cell wall biosynthesis
MSGLRLEDKMFDQNRSHVSVIMPTYNRAHVLGRAIKSVLEQTFTDFELIIVDDGSTDNTEEVIKSFNDPRIRCIRHERNRGVSAARNTGIKIARGDCIAFQDSDDEWLPQKLERQMAVFEQDNAGNLGLVICGLQVPNRTKSRFVPSSSNLDFEKLIYHRSMILGTVTLMINRTLAGPELYFDEDLLASEDWELVLRLSRRMRIGCLGETLVRLHHPAGPHAHDIENTLNAQLVILKKYATELQARPRALNRHHEQAAMSYYEMDDMHHTRSHLRAAIRAYPWRPASYFYLISSFLGRFAFHQCRRICYVAGNLARQITAAGVTLHLATTGDQKK